MSSGAPLRQRHVLERELDEETALYDTHEGKVHFLNPTAAAVWHLCDGSHSPAEIAADICQRYQAAAETVEEDVAQVLRTFREKKLIE